MQMNENESNNNINTNLNGNDSNSLGAIVINNSSNGGHINSLEDFEKEVASLEEEEEKTKAAEVQETNAEVTSVNSIVLEPTNNVQQPQMQYDPNMYVAQYQQPQMQYDPNMYAMQYQQPQMQYDPNMYAMQYQQAQMQYNPNMYAMQYQQPQMQYDPNMYAMQYQQPQQVQNNVQENTINTSVESNNNEPTLVINDSTNIETVKNTESVLENSGESVTNDVTLNTENNVEVPNEPTVSNENVVQNQNTESLPSDNNTASQPVQVPNNDQINQTQNIDQSQNNILPQVEQQNLPSPENVTDAIDTTITDSSIANTDSNNTSNEPTNENNNTVENVDEDYEQVKDIADIEKSTKEEKDTIQIGKTEKNFVIKIEKVKKREIFDIIECLYGGSDKKISSFEKSIINKYIDEYVDCKYLNKNEFNGHKNYYENIKENLVDFTKKIYKDAKNDEEKNMIIRVANIFLLVNILDSEEKFDINTRMLNTKNLKFENKGTIIKSLLKVFKYYDSVYENFVKKLKSNTFSVSYDLISDKYDLYATNVSANIQFNDIYSKEVIAKAYEEDVIFENLKEIQLRLMSIRICDELLSFKHSRKYTIYFPESIYEKEKKFKSLLGIFDDEYSQNKIFIVVNPDMLNKYNKFITELRKNGYRFVVEIHTSYLSLVKDLKLLFSIADYVVIIGSEVNKKDLSNTLPSYLYDKVIYTDKDIDSGVICE